MDAISHTSRSTLTEIRRMLGVLRDDGGASYSPAPGLADLDRLVRDVGGAGLDVDVRNEGAPHGAAAGRRPHRVSHRAGGADQRVEARGPGARATVVVGYERERVATRDRSTTGAA